MGEGVSKNTSNKIGSEIISIKKKNSFYKWVAWAAIINLVFFFFAMMVVVLRINSLTIAIGIIEFIVTVLILIGFIKLAEKTRNKILKVTAIMTIILVAVFLINLSNLYYTLILASLMTLVTIIFGISILKLKELFGKIATALGIIIIISGFLKGLVIMNVYAMSFAVLFLGLLTIPISVAILIIEAILFFRASRLKGLE